MLVLFWLTAGLLQELVHARMPHQKPVGGLDLPGGLPDGSIITFFFKHLGNQGNPESARIDFYDFPGVSLDEMAKKDIDDITAHLRLDRDHVNTIASASYVNGEWHGTANPDSKWEWSQDEVSPSIGWWRVDVYKHDNVSMSVFFQGFLKGLRTFEKSLNDVRSVYVTSEYVDKDSVQIRLKLPNPNANPMSHGKFQHDMFRGTKTSTPLVTISSLPIGSYIEMTTIMRSYGITKKTSPSLIFVPKNRTTYRDAFFMKIHQKWDGVEEPVKNFFDQINPYKLIKNAISPEARDTGTQEMYLTNFHGRGSTTRCGTEKPHGDLQHFRLERIRKNEVMMTLYYQRSAGAAGVTCFHTIPEDLAILFDAPFVKWRLAVSGQKSRKSDDRTFGAFCYEAPLMINA